MKHIKKISISVEGGPDPFDTSVNMLLIKTYRSVLKVQNIQNDKSAKKGKIQFCLLLLHSMKQIYLAYTVLYWTKSKKKKKKSIIHKNSVLLVKCCVFKHTRLFWTRTSTEIYCFEESDYKYV